MDGGKTWVEEFAEGSWCRYGEVPNVRTAAEQNQITGEYQAGQVDWYSADDGHADEHRGDQ